MKDVAAKFSAGTSAAIALDLIAAGVSPAINGTLNATFTSITSSLK